MYKSYSVSRRHKQPLLDFVLSSLRTCGCTLLHHTSPAEAPFRITFEAPDGERMGIIAYAFFANSKKTRNRPVDEHRFQVKYRSGIVEVIRYSSSARTFYVKCILMDCLALISKKPEPRSLTHALAITGRKNLILWRPVFTHAQRDGSLNLC